MSFQFNNSIECEVPGSWVIVFVDYGIWYLYWGHWVFEGITEPQVLVDSFNKTILIFGNHINIFVQTNHPLRLDNLQALGSPNLHYSGSNFSAFFFLLRTPIWLWALK